MTSVILLAAALFVGICALAFTLATYALPFVIGLAASRLILGCGAAWAFAAIAGLAVGVSSFAALVYLRAVLRRPFARFAVAVIYAAPAAVAGYALMHGLVSDLPIGEFCSKASASQAVGSSRYQRHCGSRRRDEDGPDDDARLSNKQYCEFPAQRDCTRLDVSANQEKPMTQEQAYQLYTYSVVQNPEEPRWTETGIPDIYFASFQEAKAEVTRLRDDLQSADEDIPAFRIEKIETLPLSKANLLILLNAGMGSFLKSSEIEETVG
jgi:hypothetical protein